MADLPLLIARVIFLLFLFIQVSQADVFKMNPYTGKLDNIGSGAPLIDISNGNLVSGSQTISCGKILLENGGSLLKEDGGYFLLECGASFNYLLLENGSHLLLENGGKFLLEGSHAPIAGSATPFFNASTLSTSAWVTANSSNSDIVYVGNSSVSSINGIPLSIGEQNVYLPTSDLSKVYLKGNGGDGVTFIYFGVSVPLTDSVTYLGNPVFYLGNTITYLGK